MDQLPTAFLPAERAASDELRRQSGIVSSLPISSFFEDHPEPALFVNSFRQIVWANAAAMHLADDAEPVAEAVLDARPGEFWGCIRAGEGPGGCGTSAACAFCRIGRSFRAVADAAGGPDGSRERAYRECTLERRRAGAVETLEFALWMKPVELGGERFNFITLKDISTEKRKRVLERIFFHDVLNIAAGIAAWLDLASDGREDRACAPQARDGVDRLVEEIRYQRALGQAEHGELEPEYAIIPASRILRDTETICRAIAENRDVTSSCHVEEPDFELETDPVLLGRVIVNLVKNAIEASRAGQSVACSARMDGDRAVFSVHNAAVLDAEQKALMFQRSFSTKGSNRGLGTYGARLITERYLRGSISFSSSEGEGTIFRVTVPLAGPAGRT